MHFPISFKCLHQLSGLDKTSDSRGQKTVLEGLLTLFDGRGLTRRPRRRLAYSCVPGEDREPRISSKLLKYEAKPFSIPGDIVATHWFGPHVAVELLVGSVFSAGCHSRSAEGSSS